MNISSMTPVFLRAADTRSSGGSDNSTNGVPDSQTLNNMFLQLLVAQLQNQDPLNPMDPSQFVGQLAQFSELTEVTSIEQLLQQNLPSSAGTGGSGSGGGGTQHIANPSTRTVEQAPQATRAMPVPGGAPASTGPASVRSAIPPFFNSVQGVF